MRRLFLAVALPWLAGCQTDGTVGRLSISSVTRAALSGNEAATPDDAKYSRIYNQADHLRDLVAAKRFAEASQVVERHWPWFESRLEAQREPLRLLAEDINARQQPKLEAAATPLADTADFLRAERWPEQRRRRGEAKAALASYDKLALTRRPEFRSDRAVALAQAAERFDAAGKSAAPAAFAAYDHGAETGFFAGYPVELDRPAFLRGQLATLEGRAKQIAPDAVLRWHRAIARDVPLDAEQRARVGRWLVDAAIRAGGAKRPGWKEVQGAWRLAAENGLPAVLPERPRMRVVLIDPGQQGGDGVTPVQIAAQGELAPERTTLDAALGDANLDLLLLIDPLERRLEQAVVERSSVASRFLAGERVVPNPAYEQARARAIDAQDDLYRAQYRAAAYAAPPETTAEAAAGLGNALAELVSGFRLDNAIRDIRNLPPTLRQPVYEDYKYEVAAVKANRIATVAWHALDRSSGTWRQGSAKVEEAKTFRVAYRLHDKDISRQQILREHQTEEDLVAWGEAPAMVPLAVVFRAAMSGEGYERKLGSFAQAGEELRRQRATMLAAVRPAPAPVVATPKGDARMDSVVVIYTPDGSGPGAGFYVTPDTVVTNAHVVEGHRFVDIKLRDGRKSFGRVLAVLEYADLAIVRTEARGTPAKLSTRSAPEVGSTIEIIGHPKALEYSLSRGVVSAVRKRRITDTPGAGPVTLVQTDAAASPGNSGGPWFLRDEVIAVTSFKRRDGENLNFGIHASEVRDFLRRHNVEVP